MAELEEFDDGDSFGVESAGDDTPRRTPGIKIIPKPEKDGQTEPVLLVALEPEEGLLEHIARAGYKKPFYLVNVTAIREKKLYETDAVERDYIQGKTYIFSMKKRQTQYVKFSRPGLNRITACVVNIDGIGDALHARRIEHGRHTIIGGYYGKLELELRHTEPSDIEINLNENVFAPEPTGWRKAVVDHVFKGRAFDECKYRGRVMAAMAAEIPIQLTGLVLRPLFLLYLWAMLTYDIAYGQLWSLRVRAVLEQSGNSAWFESRRGVHREKQKGLWQVLPWINPQAILGYAAVLLAVPGVVFFVINIPFNDKAPKGHQNLADWGYQDTIWITWKWAAAALGAIIALVALYIAFGWVRGSISKMWRQRETTSPTQAEIDEARELRRAAREARTQEQLDKLRQATIAIPINGAVPQSAMRGLWFRSLKRKVCRPYAVK